VFAECWGWWWWGGRMSGCLGMVGSDAMWWRGICDNWKMVAGNLSGGTCFPAGVGRDAGKGEELLWIGRIRVRGAGDLGVGGGWGGRGGRRGGGGGIGLLIGVVVGYFLGVDPGKLNQLLNNGPMAGGGGAQVAQGPLTPEEERSRKFAATILGFTEKVWGQKF